MSLSEVIFDMGVVGAGGAGFPTHVKSSAKPENVIANGAECEPLIHKDYELMVHFAEEINHGFELLIESTEAKRGYFGIKKKNQKAIEENAAEAIFVRDGLITEGTHTNFFAVKGETVFTAPKSKMILEGITRNVVLEFCDKFNIDHREEFINKDELKSYTEFFITSTTKEITPVTSIDYWTINQGEPGKITKSLQSVFKKVSEDF